MAIALVQQKQATIGAAATSAAFTMSPAPVSGNMLVCAWELNDTNPSMAGTGVTWTRHNFFLGDANHDNIALWTGVVGASAGTAQTMTQSASVNNAAGIIAEFSGVQQVVDGTPPTPTNISSASPTVTSNTPTVTGDLCVAFVGTTTTLAPTTNPNSPSAWSTLTAATNTRRIDGAYLVLPSSAAVSPQWTYAASKFALMEVVLIKPTGAVVVVRNLSSTGAGV